MRKFKIRLFPYYGSKMRIAGRYPPPQHDTIIEPFAGAAGYASRYFDRKVILYERDPIVFSVLSYLVKVKPEEILDLPLITPDLTLDDFVLTQEAKWLIGFWVNTAATAPCKRLSAWGRSLWPDMPASFWGERCRARLAASVPLIKHWQVNLCSWRDVPMQPQATWFIDPPYQEKGRFYRFNDIDYIGLASWCRALTLHGQVIVCEGEGASWLPFRPFCEQVSCVVQGGRHRRTGEVIWTGDE